MSAHALLSPSSASRWMACTPSARLEADYPDKAGEAADEGTLAHKLGETMIRRELKLLSDVNYKTAIKAIEKNKHYSDTMWEHCENYKTFVLETYAEALEITPDARIFIEERLNLTAYVPEGFGTGDVQIIGNHELHFIDLKYGKGVRVEATNNKQLMLYALGAYEAHGLLFDIERIRMTIYQPRMDNFSSWVIDVSDLLQWAEDELRPKAELAWNGEGQFNPGSHCQFCKVKATCKANMEHHMQLAQFAFEEPKLITPADVAYILDRALSFKNWLKAVETYALYEAVQNGVEWPGYKVVAGKSNRVITAPDKIAEILAKHKYKYNDYMSQPKLLGIGGLEKLVGKKKFEELAGAYIEKPDGKPVLVPESDKRPALDSATAAALAFDDEDSVDD